MKRMFTYLTMAVAIPSLLYSSTPVFAKQSKQSVKTESRLEQNSQVPHYLKDLTPVNKLENLDEFQRETKKAAEYFRTLRTRSLSTKLEGIMINNSSERETMELYGKKVEIFYNEYQRSTSDKTKIEHITPMGIEMITQEEFNVVKQDMRNQIKISLKDLMEKYLPITEEIKKGLEKKLGIEDLETIAHKQVPGYGITYGDVLGYVKLKSDTCVPKQVHLTPISMGEIDALGMSIVNARTVFYSPKGRALDYILGKPLTLTHEFNHACAELQGFTSGFDFELQASMMDSIVPEVMLFDYLGHSYLKPLKELEERYFSFNSQRMIKKIIKGMAGNYEIKREKLEEDFEKMKKIKTKFSKILPDFFADFYANKWFWMAINDKFQDNNAWLDIKMAETFEPTIYAKQGKENKGAIEDTKFLKKLEDSGVIQEIGEEAWRRMGKRGKIEELTRIRRTKELTSKMRQFSRIYHLDSMTMSILEKRLKEKLELEGMDALESEFNKLKVNINKFYKGIER